MKTLNFLLILIFMPLVLTGQDAVVSPVNMNVLYRGIVNPVEIAIPGVTSDKVTATIDNGTINRAGSAWEIIPGSLNLCVVSVLVNNKKIADKTFRVKFIPAPIAVFSGISSGTISKENSLKNAVIEAKIIDFDWDLKFSIESFTMLTSSNEGDKEIFATGNALTDKMKAQISAMNVGQSIIFKDIRVKYPDGKTGNLSPIIIKLE